MHAWIVFCGPKGERVALWDDSEGVRVAFWLSGIKRPLIGRLGEGKRDKCVADMMADPYWSIASHAWDETLQILSLPDCELHLAGSPHIVWAHE